MQDRKYKSMVNVDADRFMVELHHLYAKLYKPLQARMSTFGALCKEAKAIKSRIGISSNAASLPVAQIDGIIAKAEQILPQKAHTLHQAEQADRAFCTTHHLIDKNAHPNPVVSVLLIAICVFVDAGVNSSFLYNAHMVTGPLTALLVSFLISLTNVVVSVCAGYFIGRFVNYGSNGTDPEAPEYKAVRNRAQWQFRVFIGVVGFFLLTVGLVRSTESLDRIGHSLEHYQTLIVTPEAIFLVLLNICITVFSYHKGRTGFTHPYGDYSTVQRSVITARDDLHQCYDDLIEEVEDICADVEDDADAQVAAQAKSIKQYNKKVDECCHAYRALELATRTAQNEFSALVTKTINTQSVLEGKRILIPGGLLDQFAFPDITATELPESYRTLRRSEHDPALAKAKAAALKRLSDVFKRVLQS